MNRYKSISDKTIDFIKSTFGLSAIIQAILIAIIVMLITNYFNGLNERKNNYSRLIKELDWNLSELKHYDEFLGNVEKYLENKIDISVQSKMFFYPMFDAFPLRFQKQYYIQENGPPQNKIDYKNNYELQTRNYIISELSKSGFLYGLSRKQDIKYLEKMTNPNWLNNIIEPINEILLSIDKLPKTRQRYNSEMSVIELKAKIETECKEILSKIRATRRLLTSEIDFIEQMMSHVKRL